MRRAALAGFPRAFWVINGLELLERAAYYGVVTVLSYHLVYNVGFSSPEVGLLFAVLLPLLYFLPAVTIALAEKYGFRVSLVAAFAVLAAGYALMGTLTTFGGLLAATVLVGVGAGTFKPLVAAVVGQTTTPEQRNLGYAIYYVLINMGGFLSPLLIGIFVPEALYAFAFGLATALAALNIGLTLLFYRDLVPPRRDLEVGAAVRRLGAVARDRSFLVLLVIYSGFWFMYSMNWTFLPLYMTDFAVMPAWFNVALLGTVNPATIILLGPVLGKLTERAPSLPLMTVGIGLFVAGFAMLGFAPHPALFLGGMLLAGAGEFLTHPGFLSYVSKVAPQDKVALYLGAAFLPLGIGFAVGPAAGGYLYSALAEEAQRPKLFWALVCAVGLLTLASLLLYHRALARRGRAEALPARGRAALAGPAMAAAALLLIPAIVGAGALAGTDVFRRAGEPADVAEQPGPLALLALDGATEEGARTLEEVEVPAHVRNLTFVLTWRDEAPPGALPGTTNAPDRFRLAVEVPGGARLAEEGANPAGGEGALRIALPGASPAGTYKVSVEALDCGDVALGPGVAIAEDGGNAWHLEAGAA